MNATDTASAKLRKQIERLQSDIALRELDRAEVTIALLTKPDDAELQAQLAKAVQDIEAWRVALEGTEGALALAQSRDVEADRAADEAARQQAAAEARALLSDSLKAAAAVDKAIAAFVAALERLNDCHRQVARLSYDCGVQGQQRNHLVSNLLSIKHAGGVLAARLLLAGLHDRLDYVTVTRPAFSLDMTLVEITTDCTEKVNTQLDHALAGG